MTHSPLNNHNHSDLTSFERIMLRFYEHQAEILKIQGEYLKNQAAISQEFFQLMRQYSSLNLDGTEQSTVLASAFSENRSQASQVPITYGSSVTEANVLSPSTIEPNTDSTFLPETAPIDQAARVNLESLTRSLLEIISDKTGYPTEMLEVEMELEADLGIDSIKRVQIFGALQELYPNLPPANPEELAELRTLAQIVNYMDNHLQGAEKKILIS